MNHDHNEPNSTAASIPTTAPAIRHDGWTGEKMATFCETLAETAVVAEACEQASMGISGAYAARRRNPLFAAAWDAALSIARERLADILLARSMEGNVEQIYRDGELVGERHFLDNRLGLQILRRLDRLADTPSPVRPEPRRGAVLSSKPIDWGFAVEALRAGDDDGVARSLAIVKSSEVEEVEGDPDRQFCDDEDDGTIDLSDRCWKDGVEETWMTDFPPPAGFTGYESREYDEVDDDEAYVRACTAEEIAILDADAAADRLAERAEDEALRDQWSALLKQPVTAD